VKVHQSTVLTVKLVPAARFRWERGRSWLQRGSSS